MISITADKAMLDVLRQATGLAEARDANGSVVGFFAPVSMERVHLYAAAAARIDPAEFQRRKKGNGPMHTTQEVLDHLNSLEKPEPSGHTGH
jgi:hypothetical protein